MDNTINQQRSRDIPPGRYRDSNPSLRGDTLPSRLPLALKEHLLMKRVIRHWQSPRHSEYTSLAARLASFKDWPYSTHQTPESLSEAGFFYSGKFSFKHKRNYLSLSLKKKKSELGLITLTLFTGRGLDDKTTCFHCGGTLLEWLITDDAWEEHAVYYPLCVYVRHVKGEVFIRECESLRSRTETDYTDVTETDCTTVTETDRTTVTDCTTE